MTSASMPSALNFSASVAHSGNVRPYETTVTCEPVRTVFACPSGIEASCSSGHCALHFERSPSGASMATLAEPVADAATLFDPNTVKLVRAASGDALYFSRAPLPWPRDAFARDRGVLPPGGHWLRHIGIYAYRAGFLQAFARMPPGRLEQVESLEQLRVLEAGHRIAVALAPERFPAGVDTPEDLEKVSGLFTAAQFAGLGVVQE